MKITKEEKELKIALNLLFNAEVMGENEKNIYQEIWENIEFKFENENI